MDIDSDSDTDIILSQNCKEYEYQKAKESTGNDKDSLQSVTTTTKLSNLLWDQGTWNGGSGIILFNKKNLKKV